jgi:dethiobiotin synthetase/adenosylmethionine--8-amino-7-oxononanoate aminotransferase
MAMGTVFAMELEEEGGGGYSSHVAQALLRELRQEALSPAFSGTSVPDPNTNNINNAIPAAFQIHSRPLGNVVYLITSLFTPPEVVRAMEAGVARRMDAMGMTSSG